MDNFDNNELFDLGSSPVGEDFDPFALDDEPISGTVGTVDEAPVPQPQEDTPAQEETVPTEIVESAAPVEVTEPEPTEPAKATKAPEAKTEKSAPEAEEKPPVFVYAGATETIGDTSMTFDELRIEKARDFPELDDGKRVSWTVEYGKITKPVTDPKGTSIGRMKSDIETSKEFRDSLKRAKDKNPVCKIKPHVTAQSKGTACVGNRGSSGFLSA